MKKLFLMVIMLSFLASLGAVTLKTAEKSVELDIPALFAALPAELVTEKEKDGNVEQRHWQGIFLQELLAKSNISEFDQVKFSSEDNYLVRLSQEEITRHNPMIALRLNNEVLKDNNRLVIPDMPGMYWIRSVALIEIEQNPEMVMPQTLYFAEPHLAKIDLTADPAPFTDVQGYYLPQLLQVLMPSLEGQYLLTGVDGISHLLDYSDYLTKAVLVKTEKGYIMQSPQMPGGMWIKNLAYIQKGETAVIFRSQFADWQDVQTLAGWQNLPANIKTMHSDNDQKIIATDLPLEDAKWNNIQKLVW
jgi:hypothetical protein